MDRRKSKDVNATKNKFFRQKIRAFFHTLEKHSDLLYSESKEVRKPLDDEQMRGIKDVEEIFEISALFAVVKYR